MKRLKTEDFQMPNIKWGIIGPGNIASAFAHSIKHCENSDLVSVYGRDQEKVNAFSSKFNISPYTNFPDFIASKEIDAVYIATPHSSHYFYSIEKNQNYYIQSK